MTAQQWNERYPVGEAVLRDVFAGELGEVVEEALVSHLSAVLAMDASTRRGAQISIQPVRRALKIVRAARRAGGAA